MLHKVMLGMVVATLTCLLTAEDALGRFFYFGTPQPPWSVVSQGTPYGYSYSYPSYGGGYYTYSGEIALPGFTASGYVPRMRATLGPAVSMDSMAAQSGIAPAALSGGERDSIRPASSYSDVLIPRATAGAAVRYVQPAYYAPAHYTPSCAPYGYR